MSCGQLGKAAEWGHSVQRRVDSPDVIIDAAVSAAKPFPKVVVGRARSMAERVRLNRHTPQSTPAARRLARHPFGVVVSAMAAALLPLALAFIPASAGAAASTKSSSASTPGMNGMSMTPKHGSSTSSVDMSGMAGLGVTDPNWKYSGPPLPASEVAELTTVSARTDLGHKMQTPNCSATPTSDQVLGATQYVQATSEAVAKYKNLSAATAAGYFPITNPSYPVVHYLNLAYMNMKDLLNPNTVDSLVYATTPNGPVLVAAMYLMPSAGNGPMPYGCLVQWHAHTNLCTSDTTNIIDGFTPCPPGTHHYGPTPMMTHVWQVPVAGGPLAIDPSDLQVVQAAIMAQQEGLAPTTAAASSPTAVAAAK